MERDFMGLSPRNLSVTVKDERETTDACKDSAPVRGSGMQWSSSNKVSALPQFLSFKAAQEDKARKTHYDPLALPGFFPMSTSNAFDSNYKPYCGAVQRNVIVDKQAGTQFAMTANPMQNFDAQSVHCPREIKIFPFSNHANQTISVAFSAPVLQSHIVSTGQNVNGSTMNPQPLGGLPVIASPVATLPATSSFVGTTDLGNAIKPPGAPAQLTIFYAGSVNVYDNVSPEKAKAIMLLAGNSPSITAGMTLPTAQVQAPIPMPSIGDGFFGNQSHTTSPCLGLSSPISVTSHADSGSQLGGISSGTNELVSLKPIRASASSGKLQESPKVVGSLGCPAATLIPAVAVPQARKASLARFLEKRKERVISTLPYNVSKNSPECSTPA